MGALTGVERRLPVLLARSIASGAVLIAASIPSVARANEVWRWRPYIAEASTRFGIPTVWIERVMRAESAGRVTANGKPIRSRAGAMGLMQLMPATWDDMRRTHGLGSDPDDPRDNILAGTAYLRAMYDRFGYPGLFGAYNAGPKRYADHLATGAALPGETIAYLATVTRAGSSRPDGQGLASNPAIDPVPVERLFAVRAVSPPSSLPLPIPPSLPPSRPPLEPPSPVAATPPATRSHALFAIRSDAR